LSTSTTGPCQVTSKYDLMAMLYAEGVKKRLVTEVRVEEGTARNADRAVRGWGMVMAGVAT
jgi:hypothetical protein